jgi:hypothetical protein
MLEIFLYIVSAFSIYLTLAIVFFLSKFIFCLIKSTTSKYCKLEIDRNNRKYLIIFLLFSGLASVNALSSEIFNHTKIVAAALVVIFVVFLILAVLPYFFVYSLKPIIWGLDHDDKKISKYSRISLLLFWICLISAAFNHSTIHRTVFPNDYYYNQLANSVDALVNEVDRNEYTYQGRFNIVVDGLENKLPVDNLIYTIDRLKGIDFTYNPHLIIINSIEEALSRIDDKYSMDKEGFTHTLTIYAENIDKIKNNYTSRYDDLLRLNGNIVEDIELTANFLKMKGVSIEDEEKSLLISTRKMDLGQEVDFLNNQIDWIKTIEQKRLRH